MKKARIYAKKGGTGFFNLPEIKKLARNLQRI